MGGVFPVGERSPSPSPWTAYSAAGTSCWRRSVSPSLASIFLAPRPPGGCSQPQASSWAVSDCLGGRSGRASRHCLSPTSCALCRRPRRRPHHRASSSLLLLGPLHLHWPLHRHPLLIGRGSCRRGFRWRLAARCPRRQLPLLMGSVTSSGQLGSLPPPNSAAWILPGWRRQRRSFMPCWTRA
jgi:hypothetical protein